MRNSKHTKEFRDSTVQLAMNSDEPMIKIAEDLGVHVKTLYAWVKEYKKEHNIKIGHSRTSKESLDEENVRLRKENKLLKQERDILKKATAYFAKDLGTPLRGELYKIRVDQRAYKEFQYIDNV